MISRVEYKKEAPGLRYDPEKKVWIGYRVDVIVGGKRDRTGGFGTKKKAQDYIDALKDRQRYARRGLKTQMAAPRVSELFEQRLAQIKDRRERVRGKRIFKYFLSLLEYDLKVDEVRGFHFQLFINGRLADGVKERTANRELTLLSTAFNKAPSIFPKELENFEPPRMARAKVPRQQKKPRVVTEQEKDAICAYLYAARGNESQKVYQNRVRIGRMFECAWLLGLRFSEVARLLKTDLSGRSLRVIRWKTQDVTTFDHLPNVVVDLLVAAIADSETNYVFTHSGNYPKDFYNTLRRAVESAGLVYGRDARDGITFHRLRHSFITRLVQVTDIATAASFSGHSDGAMVAHYSHASDESRREAMNKLYGEKIDVEKIRQFYDNVVSGKVTFEDFLTEIKAGNF